MNYVIMRSVDMMVEIVHKHVIVIFNYGLMIIVILNVIIHYVIMIFINVVLKIIQMLLQVYVIQHII